MVNGGLFLSVNELCGDAVVLGTVRRVEVRGDTLSIRGLDLTAALAILGALATGDLATVKLGGMVPAAPPSPREAARAVAAGVAQGAALGTPPAPPGAPREAPVVRTPETAIAALAATGPAPSPTPAEVFGPEAVVPPPPRPVEAPSGAPEAPVAPTPQPDPAAPANAPPELPREVASAQTLRPVIGYMHETRGVRGLGAMIEAVTALGPQVKLVAQILRDEPDKFKTRVERTMTVLGML